jgi:hypothetical protein
VRSSRQEIQEEVDVRTNVQSKSEIEERLRSEGKCCCGGCVRNAKILVMEDVPRVRRPWMETLALGRVLVDCQFTKADEEFLRRCGVQSRNA